jgi:voltage-gated potassium channel
MFSINTRHPPSESQLWKQIRFLIILLSASFFVTTTLFWIFEHGQTEIRHFGDAIWWWFVTSATVGYGDLVPYTLMGRTAGVIAIIIGIFGYTHIIGIILQVIQHKFEKEERGRGSVDFKDHVVICEYTAFADELIQEIKEHQLFNDRKLVVVGSLVNRTPYSEHSFIYGEPISPQVLQRANISEAGIIFVFSNNRFTDPDTKTLHVVSRIKKQNSHAPLYVELQKENHPLLKKLPGDVIVMKSSDMLQKAIAHKFIDVEQYLEE